MAYLPNTASSPIDQLQKIVAWLVGIGWTQDMSQADGAGWRAHLHKGTNYVHLRAMVNERPWTAGIGDLAYGLACYLGTGFSAGAAWPNQAGGPIGTGVTDTVGVSCATAAGAIPAFHCFSDASGDNIAIITERVAGVFTYLAWGSLVKAGTWTGGAYFGGSRSGFWANNSTGSTAACPFTYGDNQSTGNYFVRADVDTFTGKWLSPCSIMASWYQGLTGGISYSPLFQVLNVDTSIPGYGSVFEGRQFSAMNSLAILLPIHLYAKRDAAVGGASLLGQVPGIYKSIATAKGLAVGSTYSIGADNYVLFPNFAVRKVV